ncbi:plasmid mobilization protein [Candidatus Binatus sp.]|uniref:plasmid mobilization protein n=1 Tax=Candidatus Binatus sp. TaxID=2811406 RepID=UPI003F94D324
MKRRKPKAERKAEMIQLRVSPEQKQTLVQAAKAAGLELSAWLRSLGLREANRTT